MQIGRATNLGANVKVIGRAAHGSDTNEIVLLKFLRIVCHLLVSLLLSLTTVTVFEFSRRGAYL